MPHLRLSPPTPLLALVAVLLLVSLGGVRPSLAQTIETSAREAYLVDVTTGTVLLDKNGDQRMPTASMSKIMTMYMVFEALAQGRLSMDDTLPVSERAWRKGGSKMFVEVGDQIRVEDLIRGVIIQSGNDASIVLAEALAGTEQAFGLRMTERARELGMVNSQFMNATGWPHPQHFSTAQDLALLAHRLIVEFPEFYHFYSELEFEFNDIRQGNRNPLLYRDMGADGLKTGHTSEAGYGLTASARRGDRRLILVVNGLDSAQARADEAARLMEWGFREFEARKLFDAGETVDAAAVWQGTAADVPMVVEDDTFLTLRRIDRDNITVTVSLDEPVPAPIAAGQPLGLMTVRMGDHVLREVPLVAGTAVPRQGIVGRFGSTMVHMVSSLWQ